MEVEVKRQFLLVPSSGGVPMCIEFKPSGEAWCHIAINGKWACRLVEDIWLMEDHYHAAILGRYTYQALSGKGMVIRRKRMPSPKRVAELLSATVATTIEGGGK